MMELLRFEVAVLEPLQPRHRKQTVKYYVIGAKSKKEALRAMAADMDDITGLPSRRGEILGCIQRGTFERVVFHGARNVTPDEAADIKAKWAKASEEVPA